MPSKSFNDDNLSRGKNFARICEILFPGESRRLIGAKLGGVSEGSVRNWEKGSTIPNRVLAELARRGVSLTWLLSSEGEMLLPGREDSAIVPLSSTLSSQELPEPNAVRQRGVVNMTRKSQRFSVVGTAAADESQGSRAGIFPEDASQIWDEVEIPETTHFVKIKGDSMAPVFLDGQYAMVGPEHYGPYDQPQNREISDRMPS